MKKDVFRRFHRARSHQDANTDWPVLDEMIAQVRSADPETEHAWRTLRRSIETVPVRTIQWQRPALVGAFAVAATVAIIMLLPRPHAPLVYSTARARQSSILLADSTEVTLNHTSTLTVAPVANDGTRRVILEGEACFHVRHNGFPFIVQTRAGQVRVLGTLFNVKMRGDEVTVDVLHGRVRLASAVAGDDSAVVLGAEQRSRCTIGGSPESAAPFARLDTPDWMSGRLTFSRVRLDAVVRELEETCDIRIVTGSPELRSLSVTGTIDVHDPGAALQTLSLLAGAKLHRTADAFVLE
jgi:transmembrane sensor